jgi:hypothetical protein
MSKIYVGQTALIFRDTTGINLSSALETKMKYRKPDRTEGAFPATIVDVAGGVIEYSVQSASDLDQPGVWVRWAHVTFNDGSVAPGEPIEFKVYREGGKEARL